MIVPKDIAIDSFEAALAMLCGAYLGAGLPAAEIHGALQRRRAAIERRAACERRDADAPSEPRGGADGSV